MADRGPSDGEANSERRRECSAHWLMREPMRERVTSVSGSVAKIVCLFFCGSDNRRV